MQLKMKTTVASLLAVAWLLTPATGQQQVLGDQSPFYEQAIATMEKSPLIDTHVDLPQIIRSLGGSTLCVCHRKALLMFPQVVDRSK